MKLQWIWDRLAEIKAIDQKLARDFMRRLRTDRFDDYLGTLCEMNVACILIRNHLTP